MRFGDWERARQAASARREPIDYTCFVATLAAAQASTPTARVAGAAVMARRAEVCASIPAHPAGGSFHRATALALAGNPAATKVKPPFTVAF